MMLICERNDDGSGSNPRFHDDSKLHRGSKPSLFDGPFAPAAVGGRGGSESPARKPRPAARTLTVFAAFLALLFTAMSPWIPAANAQRPVTFVDWSWDSVQVHNRIAGFILRHGYGYEVDYLFADTLPGFLALQRGNAHIGMETWYENFQESWQKALDQGLVVPFGNNFPDAPQGWYVPTYLIKGDPERGIEPLAPDLRSVTDLPRYWELFRDPESPNKGRFYNAPTGWLAHSINNAKFEAYGLLDTFNPFDPGSDAALASSMMAAYQRGQPWVGYYWEPTWVMGLLDMTLLEEPEYTDECWATNYGCAYPLSTVVISANARFIKDHPDIAEFLTAYETTLEQNNDMLAHMQQSGGSAEAAALYFLEKYRDTWHQWVPDDVAAKVEQALEAAR